MKPATCISCWCDDLNACDDGLGGACSWLKVDRKAGVGVCSSCSSALPLWDFGVRQLLAKPDRIRALLRKKA